MTDIFGLGHSKNPFHWNEGGDPVGTSGTIGTTSDNDFNIVRNGENKITIGTNINVNDNIISSVSNPVNEQDAATKNYVDNVEKKCHVGYVPLLESANDGNGFIVQTSSEYNNNYAGWKIFSYKDSTHQWAPRRDTNNFWIRIRCPEQVRVWKLALKGGSSSNRIYDWKFEGSNNGRTWTELYRTTNTYLGNITRYIDIDTSNKYQYYSLHCYNAEDNPSLTYMQIYVYSD